MNRMFIVLLLVSFAISSYDVPKSEKMTDNPFFVEWNTPHGVPPFDIIETIHYLPAYKEGISRQDEEIKSLSGNKDQPTFLNTIVALDQSGAFLTRVDNVFENLNEADTDPQMQEIAREAAPMLSAHHDGILLNEDLFQRVKQVYDEKDQLDLAGEELMLLTKTYDRFVRGGANLKPDQKERFMEINSRLSMLSIQFGENILAETNGFKLVIDNEDDLHGLPESVKQAAAETAVEEDMSGKWIFTLHKPSLIPFITYADNRALRQFLFNGYINRGNNGNEFDNRTIVNEMVNLRIERAGLLGYDNHASYVLDKNMSKNPENVYKLLDDLMTAALPIAQEEAKSLQAIITKEGSDFKLEPWDWWYYAEKLKKQKFAFDDGDLRPYFQLDNVRNGVFDVAGELYGLQFVENNELPTYHPEAHAYEVHEADGSFIGVLYMDFFPRASKRGGAWMTSFRKQSKIDGENITPVIQVVCNFSKPTGDAPALLSFEEASTLFHEFGHALHGLLSDCNYLSLSGTSVPRDFVELPSQIMENWAANPEVLSNYALHYQTGEPIPSDLLDKMDKARHFNQGFTTVEFISAAILDMDWHTLTQKSEVDVMEFESSSLEKMNMIDEIVVRYRSPYFAHIFAGGYSAGYYSYAWAEVLDADAFEAFKENGIYDKETALAFRQNILERGGTEDPMELYVRFRGQEPKPQAMLERKGLNN